MKKLAGILLICFLVAAKTVVAGVATIEGPTTVNWGANNYYTASMDIYPSGSYYWYGGDIQSSSATGAIMKIYASGYVSYSLETWDDYYWGSLEVTLNVPTPDASGAGVSYSCGSSTVSRSTGPGSGIKWYWQTSPSGTSTSLGYGSSFNLTSSSAVYLRALYDTDPYTWSAAQTIYGSAVAIKGSVTGAGSISGGSSHVWTGTAPSAFTSASLPSTVSGTYYTFQWQKQEGAGSWTNIGGATGSTYIPGNVSDTTNFRRNVIADCDNAVYPTTAITVTVVSTPTVTSSATPAIAIGASVTLQSNPGSLATIQWIKDGVDITTGNGFPSNATSSTYAAIKPGVYQIRVTHGSIASSSTSPGFRVYPIGGNPSGEYNLAATLAVRKAGITAYDQLYNLSSSEFAQNITYADGAGRVRQSVNMGQSPLEKDIVVPAAYDSISTISYLPYSTSVRDGQFKTNALDGGSGYSNSAQKSFYSATTAVASDSYPFAKTLIENSPLARATEQGSFGSTWQTGSGHTTITSTRQNNGAFPVRKWSTAGPSGYYSANTLVSAHTTDENGNKIITYADNEGNIVLKRVQTSSMSDSVTWLETYAVYDNRGNLAMQIPPSASAALNSGTSWDSTAFRDKWCFVYRYDGKNQLVEKKSPGAAWIYYVYDALGRLVLTQDGNLRTANKWVFVKYDYKMRPVMTGTYTNATYTTRASIQSSLIDPLYSNPSDPYYEERGTTLEGYTNVSFPTNSAVIYTVNYYDTYDFDYNGTDDYSYTSQSLTGEHSQGNSFGMPTGSKRIIVGTANWLYSYVFYDRLGRAIQSRSNNHLSSSVDNLVTNVYSFEGKTLQTKSYHNAGGSNQTTVLNTYSYDHAGRVLTIKQKNNSDSEQTLVKYNYNELGQLVDKQLHNTGGSNYLQSVDFRYNIRGWLTSINNSQLSNDGTLNNDTGDFFGMELAYEGSAGMSNTAMYNGNISALKWKTFGEDAGTAGQRSYKYSYDKSDRLLQATFQAYGTSSWNKETNTLNEGMTYDHNGNILTLLRKQNERGLSGTTITSSAQSLDDLTYTYATGNQLSKVDDAVSTGIGTGDFKNGVTATTEYTYNADGALTTDDNKDIDSVKYNDLGKVARVKFGDGHFITYVYDASGTKLTMKSYNTSGTLTTTTDYVGSFVYNNGALDFFGSPEGRVVKNASGLEYQYSIADHQGNTRIVFTSATPTAVTLTATFEGDGGDDSDLFEGDFGISSFPSANHTPGGSNVVPMNQSTPVGPSKSLKVYPGDKIDLEVYSYFESSSGYGSSNVNVAAMITAVAGAFGGVSMGSGESGKIYAGISDALNGFGLGSNPGDDRPAAFLNYILYDQNYKVVTMGWSEVPASANFSKQKVSIPQLTIKEAGYLFAYLSYENASNNYVYFDDFKVTHTPTSIIQSNEYYPFGMQTAGSWTREGNDNSFLYNQGSELTNSTWYETFFRGFDPTLGRFNSVDPLSDNYAPVTPYVYGVNNPARYNDPTGAYPGQLADAWVYAATHYQEGGPYSMYDLFTMVAGEAGGGTGGNGGHYEANTYIVYDYWNTGDGKGNVYSKELMGFHFETQYDWVSDRYFNSFQDDDRRGESSPNSTYTLRDDGVNYNTLLNEFFSGEGPEYSIFPANHPMTKDLKNSWIVGVAQARYLLNNISNLINNRPLQSLRNYDVPFGLLGIPMSGVNMTEQFVGGARVSIIPSTSGQTLYIVNNTTDFNSLSYHAGNSFARDPNNATPMGTVYQRFVWTKP